jgi:GNAT superfamily N-acetyltransferase
MTPQADVLQAALPPGARAPRDTGIFGLRGWVPIRTLGARHRDRVVEHLLALDNNDRVLRFGQLASDERIRSYAEQIDFERDEVFGSFDHRLKLVAMAHLALDGAKALAGGSAEFGVSVNRVARGRGLGGQLFAHAVMHARNRGVATMVIHMARDNAAMLSIVRRAGAAIHFEHGEGLAQLPLPADTLGSQIEEMLGHQAAELDYRLKMQVLRLDSLRPGRAPRDGKN